MPLELATRLFECFMVEGETVFIKLIINMLRFKRKKILRMYEENLMQYIRYEAIVECVDEYSLD